MKKIYTENPIKEQWIYLKKYTIKDSIDKLFQKKGYDINEINYDLIQGSFQQAFEYFSLSSESSLFTSPILIYYGLTNLLNGVSYLVTGEEPQIDGHGIRILTKPENISNIGDIKFVFHSPNNGALSVFNKALGDNIDYCTSGEWSVYDFLGCIPELYDFFMDFYSEVPSLLKVEKSSIDDTQYDKIVIDDERINNLVNNLYDFDIIRSTYLHPQNNGECAILRRKYRQDDIVRESCTTQYYLHLPLLKNNVSIIPQTVIAYYVVLFVLSYLCRYIPRFWYNFINNTDSGERLIVERFIQLSTRFLPNLLLNEIEEDRIFFTNTIHKDTN